MNHEIMVMLFGILISLSGFAQTSEQDPPAFLVFCQSKTTSYEFDFKDPKLSVATVIVNGRRKREPIEMTFVQRTEDRLVTLMHPVSYTLEFWSLPISLFDTFNLGVPVLVSGWSSFLRLSGECTAQK